MYVFPTVCITSKYLNFLYSSLDADSIEGSKGIIENLHDLMLTFLDDIVEVANITEKQRYFSCVVGYEVFWLPEPTGYLEVVESLYDELRHKHRELLGREVDVFLELRAAEEVQLLEAVVLSKRSAPSF